MEWNKTYGGAKVDKDWDIELTADGGYIIAGLTKSFGAGDWDIWLIKTSCERTNVDQLCEGVILGEKTT